MFLHNLNTYTSVLPSASLFICFYGQPPFTLFQCLPVSQPGRLGREATERTLETDSKLRETPLIRAALWLHTALFTLVSLKHSWPIVTKHGEALGPSYPRPLWATVTLTSWSQTWFLPRLVCQRIYRMLSWKPGRRGVKKMSVYHAPLWAKKKARFSYKLRRKFPTMPCWLFMAWFHIHLSTPSLQMSLRIYVFLRQWCYQSGKLLLDGEKIIKGVYDWINTTSTRLCSGGSIKV